MSKGKINFSQKTKLYNYDTKQPKDIKGFITQSKQKKITKSFRLNDLDLQVLNMTVQKINKESDYRTYSESEIIRGLIHLSQELKVKKIIETLQQKQ
jgi:hypothetical protein